MRSTRVAILASVALVAASARGQEARPVMIAPMKAPLAPATQTRAPEIYGTSGASYVTVPQWEFEPGISSWGWADTGGTQPLRYTQTPGTFYNASPHLPSGALLTSLEFDYCDDNETENLSVILFNLDKLNHAIFNLGSVASTGAPGCTSGIVDLTPANYRVDNANERLLLQLYFGANGDSTTRFAGVTIGYKLQVSPDPAIQTFTDVPLSHPFHRYIEALAAAGITGGCNVSPPLYCPNAPVTRGQMAVFLSVALGLYWPN